MIAAEDKWRPIETAPRNRSVLLFGKMRPHEMFGSTEKLMVFSGYWDEIDTAWCSTGSTWTGPFFEPTHWMPLPLPPGVAGQWGRG